MISVAEAIQALKRGEVIAYPTEAVYGLGCDPTNETALQTLLALKQRSATKGLIVVAAEFAQLENFVKPISSALLETILATWPGPYTWVFPAKPIVSKLIRGDQPTIAVRISAHPVIQQLCRSFGPLISTSANKTENTPIREAHTITKIFGPEIKIVAGELGSLQNPTSIRDALTGKILRSCT